MPATLTRPAPLRDRLDEMFERDANGCLLWMGALTPQGYARVTLADGSTTGVHRLVYERAHGSIPAGLTIDHTCHNADMECRGGPTCRHRRCGNVDHLEAVEAWENTRRGGRAKSPVCLICGADYGVYGEIARASDGSLYRSCRKCEGHRRYQRSAWRRYRRDLPEMLESLRQCREWYAAREAAGIPTLDFLKAGASV